MTKDRPARPVRVGGVLALVVGCSALVLAQPPRNVEENPPSTVGQVDSNAPPPTFRAGVTLVTTDVIVRNGDGVFIPDLTQDDFQLMEDGVEQEIASLILVHGGRVFNQLQPPAPVRQGIILPASSGANQTAGRIFILFIDDLHLTPSMTPKVRQVFTEVIDTLIHEGDLFGIISTGPSSLSIDMTYDRGVLYGAIDRITGDALSIQDQVTARSYSGGSSEVLWRAHVAFKTARDVLRNLEEVTDRRKAFIYMSNGYDFNPFPEKRLYSNPDEGIDAGGIDQFYGDYPEPSTDPFEQRVRQNSQFADADLAIEIAELARMANRANTSFYTLDPRGLVAAPDMADDVSPTEWRTHMLKTQNTLRTLADLTGGIAVVNRNDFDDALREIDAETSDYYIVGFYTSNPDPTVRTRQLDIQVRDRDDLDVRARTHYTLPRGPA
jgi:VWFA-related protein